MRPGQRHHSQRLAVDRAVELGVERGGKNASLLEPVCAERAYPGSKNGSSSAEMRRQGVRMRGIQIVPLESSYSSPTLL